MVPTDDAMITRQMLYPGLPVPATAAFAMTSSVHSRLPLLNRTLECSLIRRVDSTLAPAHVAMAASPSRVGKAPRTQGTDVAQARRSTSVTEGPLKINRESHCRETRKRKKASRKGRLKLPANFAPEIMPRNPHTPAERCNLPTAVANSTSDGTDSGSVTLRSGKAAPLNASTSISIARSVFGRIKIVAASVPLRTHP